MTVEQKREQALRLARAGRIEEARRLFQDLLDADPAAAEALHFFGVLAMREGRAEAAAELFGRAVAACPEQAKSHNGLGCALQAQGDLPGAEAAFRRAADAAADPAEACFNLGIVLGAQGRQEAAAQAFRRAIAAAPDMAEAHSALSAALKLLDRLEDAAAAARRALDLQPALAAAHNNLANAARALGREAEAEAGYRRAAELAPGEGLFHGNLGASLVAQGRLGDAEAALRRAIELAPEHGEPYRLLAELADLTADSPLIERMERLAAASRLAASPRADLHFALAKTFEKGRGYDRAFAHFAAANRLLREGSGYDAEREAAQQAELAALVDAAQVARLAGAGEPSAAPIFVLGMPRSGTTLVEQILASHSAVTAGGEHSALSRVANRLGFPRRLAELDPAALAEAGAAYLAAARPAGVQQVGAPQAGGGRFTDKTPSNFLRVGLIRLALPNARIVHCLRDPVDTCLACYRVRFARGQGFAYDLAELGRYYRGYRALMEHWDRLFPGALLEVRYEDLIADQEGQTRRLLDFCGLGWEEACLSFHETGRVVKTASATQVRRPLYADAVRRWTRYEAHLGPLLEALGPFAAA